MNFDRPDHGLMLYTGCSAKYTNSDGTEIINILPGDMIYVPKGIRYRVDFYDFEEPNKMSDYLINFMLYDESGTETALSKNLMPIKTNDIPNIHERFSELLFASRNGAYPKTKIKAMLYNLISDISLVLESNEKRVLKNSPVKPAIEYILANYRSENIKISEMSKLCHMSDANFRKAFKKYKGMSPKAYITQLKLNYATKLLNRGDMSVEEVSRYIGIDDSSYFIRFYKKNLGISPGKIIKNRQHSG